MDRYSRTGRVFQRRATSDGEVVVAPSRSDDPGFLRRLAWRVTPKVTTDWAELADAIQGEAQIDVFCDNSIFADDTPGGLWEALLAAPERLVITPRVWRELLPWLEKRPNHRLAAAIHESNPGIGICNEPEPGQTGRRAFDYYMALLKIRRTGIVTARGAFRRQHGRDPDLDEERELPAKIQQTFGERGRLIALKPSEHLTDEALVYLAASHAISTGRQTLVLTEDADVEEQFFKLLWLVETHYRGMLLADKYAADPGAFRTQPIPDRILNDPDGPFEPGGVLVERDAFMQDLLPPGPTFVAISCWNTGTYTSTLAFGAETQMNGLLQTKDITGGLSTSLLGGRNMHASVSPLPVGGRDDWAAIVHDRRKQISSSGATIAKLDVMQALMTDERHSTVTEQAPE